MTAGEDLREVRGCWQGAEFIADMWQRVCDKLDETMNAALRDLKMALLCVYGNLSTSCGTGDRSEHEKKYFDLAIVRAVADGDAE